MNDMIRAVIGAIAGAVAMFLVGIVLWASPLAKLAYGSTGDAQNAAVQVSLAANLPHTGRYIVPDPSTAGGTVLYGRGPIATIDYNMHGYSMSDGATMLGGFVQEAVASLMIALSLLAVSTRITDFTSRFRLAIGLSAAATVMITLSDPIFGHGPWNFAIYNLVACLLMLTAASFVIVRWFLPRA